MRVLPLFRPPYGCLLGFLRIRRLKTLASAWEWHRDIATTHSATTGRARFISRPYPLIGCSDRISASTIDGRSKKPANPIVVSGARVLLQARWRDARPRLGSMCAGSLGRSRCSGGVSRVQASPANRSHVFFCQHDQSSYEVPNSFKT